MAYLRGMRTRPAFRRRCRALLGAHLTPHSRPHNEARHAAPGSMERWVRGRGGEVSRRSELTMDRGTSSPAKTPYIPRRSFLRARGIGDTPSRWSTSSASRDAASLSGYLGRYFEQNLYAQMVNQLSPHASPCRMRGRRVPR